MDPGCKTAHVKAPALSDRETERFASVLKALANPVRLRMVDLIHRSGGETCVCEFERHFELSQPTISHHLKVLREAGVLESRQDRTWVYHSIRPHALDELAVHLSSISS